MVTGMKNRNIGFWVLHGPGWLLLLYLVYAQAIPAFNYDLGVSMGTQESAERITEIGVAFFHGFAFGDLVLYVPLLALGLIGDGLGRNWGQIVFSAALGITAYWPVVCLAAFFVDEYHAWRTVAQRRVADISYVINYHIMSK